MMACKIKKKRSARKVKRVGEEEQGDIAEEEEKEKVLPTKL